MRPFFLGKSALQLIGPPITGCEGVRKFTLDYNGSGPSPAMIIIVISMRKCLGVDVAWRVICATFAVSLLILLVETIRVRNGTSSLA